MTGIALSGKAKEDSGGGLFVALLALKCSVRTEERKTILVILHLLVGDVPTPDRVALLAIGTILATMDVGVAIRTILGYIGENRFHVALGALNFFMHPGERIFCLVVIEFRDRSNGSPTGGGVAIFTRDR
jgi:hypothetical protein